METYKYVIVGGGVAGVTAAETIRQNDKEGTLAIVSDEPYPLYSRVMLSKPTFFLGKIPFDSIYLKKPEWYTENKIAYITGKKATSLAPLPKTLTLSDGSQIGYEKLLLAVGVDARPWGILGSERRGVHYLRTLDHGRGVIEHIKTAKKAIVIGGGFIGFEMADMLHMAGLEVTMLLREKYFWEPTLDENSGRMIEDALKKGGVTIRYETEVAEVLGGENVEGVKLKDSSTLACDLIMCGIGVTYPIEWLRPSLKLSRGIMADEYLMTNAPDVWTAGDVAEYHDVLLGETVLMGNWVNAREQGRVAALNMLGQKTIFKFISFYTTQGMGISIAFVGDTRVTPDRTIITRGSPEANSYGRLILMGGKVLGATLINRTKEMNAISRLIDHNVDVSAHHAELADANFELMKLMPK
ncbi:MAG TPA: FAD-dependent oxidoreductase [Candidatus Paceibacterota bacterium]|nr:FAD-dependent oxidoreductase [Candidatus Paceibacterota bacterium]